MEAKITNDKDLNDVPYSELRIHPEDECYEITFRKYPKRVFVAVEDNRNNPSSGADLDDCWIAPTVIIEKTLHKDFDPFKAFIKAETYLGNIERPSDPGERDIDYEIYQQIYSEVENTVKKWITGA